jgi:cell division protein FtsB
LSLVANLLHIFTINSLPIFVIVIRDTVWYKMLFSLFKYKPVSTTEDNEKKHSKSTRTRGLLRRIVILSLVLVGLLSVIGFFGIRSERSRVFQAKSTDSNYSSPGVCAYDANDDVYISLKKKEEATSDGFDFVHCGDCGLCSNEVDIELMIRTKDTLTKDATKCAMRGLFLGDDKVDGCLQDIGFTPDCSTCWKSNIQCTIKNCTFTCLKAKLLAEPPNNIRNDQGGFELNDCLECDEKMCGTDFVECAGANRRRLGIVSDIRRDIDQQCTI